MASTGTAKNAGMKFRPSERFVHLLESSNLDKSQIKSSQEWFYLAFLYPSLAPTQPSLLTTFHFNSPHLHFLLAEFQDSAINALALTGSAGIAQSVERLTRNEQVIGSIPIAGSPRQGFFLPKIRDNRLSFPFSPLRISHTLDFDHPNGTDKSAVRVGL